MNERAVHRDIVVVGASAGGVEALRTLVGSLPTSFPAVVLVVLHIPPDMPSELHAVLGRATRLPVTPAQDGEPILPGHVYVAPADHHLVLETDRIRVTRGPKENRMRPSVDVLFRSAAYIFGPRAIGVVLSGMLDDGTAGLWALKDRGGVALVQSPEDALFPSMPESALKHIAADYVLPVADMPLLLTELTREPVTVGTTAPSKALELETRIALEGNALKGGVMKLGPVSANTCPECHGVLIRVREGPIVRYRCHTGHAYSLETLLAEVNEELDTTLWNALRAIEERILLLQEMEQNARTYNDVATAQEYAEQARTTEQQVEILRGLILKHSVVGGPVRPNA